MRSYFTNLILATQKIFLSSIEFHVNYIHINKHKKLCDDESRK